MSASQLPEELRQQITDVLESHDTVLYMKGRPAFPQCGFSARVVEILRTHDVAFHSVNILENQELREGVKVYSDWPTIPQLYHQGKFIGGCDIVSDLDRSGELGTLLKGE